MSEIKHPAKFSDVLIPKIAGILKVNHIRTVFDPMAGTGKLVQVKTFCPDLAVFCNELEPEWCEFDNGAFWMVRDARDLGFLPDGLFGAICTSPTYGNRLADHHNAKDGSRRITYRHRLGRDLHTANTGQLQWGQVYREIHHAIWKESIRLLCDDGIFILNISDHIRGGEIVPVSDFHHRTLVSLGLNLIQWDRVETPRMGFGANAKVRVDYESIYTFKKGVV